jgi:hypothetical protein
VVFEAQLPQVVLELAEGAPLPGQDGAGKGLTGLVLGGAPKVVNGDDLFPPGGLGAGGEEGDRPIRGSIKT